MGVSPRFGLAKGDAGWVNGGLGAGSEGLEAFGWRS